MHSLTLSNFRDPSAFDVFITIDGEKNHNINAIMKGIANANIAIFVVAVLPVTSLSNLSISACRSLMREVKSVSIASRTTFAFGSLVLSADFRR